MNTTHIRKLAVGSYNIKTVASLATAVTLSEDDIKDYAFIAITAAHATNALTLPLIEGKLFLVSNNDADTAAIVKGTDQENALTIAAATHSLIFCDGTVYKSIAGNVATLPEGTATLTGAETFTNKTLTAPKINENVAVTATATELNLLDGTAAGTAVASKVLALGADKNVDVLAVADLKLGAGAGTSLTATAAEINLLHGAGAAVASGTKAALIADLANDADGTAIATAVNAIIDALQAFGIVSTT